MSEMRDLISKLDRIDERQQWDQLDAVVDQYATSNMTLSDLESMEQAARDTRPQGDGSFLSNLGATLRSAVSSETFRINYVLYHAGEKLGLDGMYGTDGRLRVLDGATYRAERVRPSDARARNLAVAQARLNILPQRVLTGFGIDQGAQGETERPTRELFFTPTARSLQSHNIAQDFRGQEPYIDVNLQGELTRVYTREANVEALRDRYSQSHPDATVMKADGSGPYFTQAEPTSDRSSTDAGASAVPDDEAGLASQQIATALATDYRDSLDDFVSPEADQGGLANNPEAVGAIKELNTRLSSLGFTTVQADSEQYSAATRQAVTDFQTAYNRMYQATYPDQANAPDIEPNIDVDGDLGPDTLNALKQVENLFNTIEELVTAGNTQESMQYKSSISKMLEESFIFEELNGRQMGELTGAVIAIDKFIGAAGGSYDIESRKETLITARTLLSDHIRDMSAEPTPNIVRLSNGAINPIGGSQSVDSGEETASSNDSEETASSNDSEETTGSNGLDQTAASNNSEETAEYTVREKRGGQGNNRLFGYEVVNSEGEVAATFDTREEAEAEAERLNNEPASTSTDTNDTITWTDNIRDNANLFFATDRTREDAQEFIDNTPISNDTYEVGNQAGFINTMIQILLGNQRVPDDAPESVAGDILNNTPRDTIELLQQHRETLNLRGLGIQRFDWGTVEADEITGEDINHNGDNIDYKFNIEERSLEISADDGSTSRYTDVNISITNNVVSIQFKNAQNETKAMGFDIVSNYDNLEAMFRWVYENRYEDA